MVYPTKKLDFNIKDKLINLSGVCFWYWNTFYSFLESCGIPSSVYLQFGKEGGKYQLMRSILELLERQGKYDLIKNISTQFYDFTPSEDGIDKGKANRLLSDFRKAVGSSLIEDEADKREAKKKADEQRAIEDAKRSKNERLQELKNKFLALYSATDKQRRGFDLEELFFELLELEEFE